MRSTEIELLCLPCAGASATTYMRWRRLVPAWLRVTPVELPGRGLRLSERPVEDFDALVDLLFAERAAQLPTRYALLGHSMGALLAHGLALRLRDAGKPPVALFALACAAPSMRETERFEIGEDDAALTAELRRQGGTPEEVLADAELLRSTLDTLRADYRVCRSYRHRREAPHAMPVHVLAGQRDEIEVERLNAWRREAAGLFTLQWFPGGHFFPREHEAAVVRAIAEELAPKVSQEAYAAVGVA
jgi:surfactin synthase thioesterase subunit